ncbi:MAG: response regulator transcription factor [Saprospiraceae bacterium]|nr:response regulator transcription factor [Saprospiraceae bacterium]
MSTKIHLGFYLLFLLSNTLVGSSEKKELQVVLRQIGHRVLHSSGDSTSRVLPVESKNENTYVISFDKPIYVSSDSLYNIVEHELGRIGIGDFITELKGCNTENVVLSFLYSQSLDSITPCGGRNIPKGCYTVEITMLKKENRLWLAWLFPLILIPLLYIYYRKTKKHSSETLSKLLAVGTYRFDIKNRELLHIAHKESLTEKEAKLLSILLAGINEIQNRDYLMTEIWTDSGIMDVPKNLDVLVSKLRKKLSLDENIKITNVHGVGYKLEIN